MSAREDKSGSRLALYGGPGMPALTSRHKKRLTSDGDRVTGQRRGGAPREVLATGIVAGLRRGGAPSGSLEMGMVEGPHRRGAARGARAMGIVAVLRSGEQRQGG